jgi:hypothetical protein
MTYSDPTSPHNGANFLSNYGKSPLGPTNISDYGYAYGKQER